MKSFIRFSFFPSAPLLVALVSSAAAPTPPAVTADPAGTYHFYVAPDGSDANPGTASQPFQTIVRASRNALPGTTIHVAPGRYLGGFRTTMSGTAARRIVYVSTNKWGARIVPPMHSDSNMAWENRGDHVDIAGFDVDGGELEHGARWTYGIYTAGAHTVVRENHVHHLAQDGPCAGGAAIRIDSYYGAVDTDVIGNTVNAIGASACRRMQGIDISTDGKVRNNVVYGIGGAAIQMWHDAHRVLVSHNTVADAAIGILVGGGDNYHARGPNDDTRVLSNIVIDCGVGIAEQGSTGPHNRYLNNLLHHNAVADFRLQNGLRASGSVAAAPRFARYGKRGNPDFRLLAGSPAIGQAAPDADPATDIAGKPRPANGADIGAWQH